MTFTSSIVHGSKHGRSIGYPTVNLEVTSSVRAAFAGHGVYAVAVTVAGKEHCGALFWGARSLFAETEPVCEIILIGFRGFERLYGKEASVSVIRRIRNAVAVKTDDELKRLIKQDIQDAQHAYDLFRS